MSARSRRIRHAPIKSWAGTCRRLLLRLDDRTLHTADFRLQ